MHNATFVTVEILTVCVSATFLNADCFISALMWLYEISTHKILALGDKAGTPYKAFHLTLFDFKSSHCLSVQLFDYCEQK